MYLLLNLPAVQSVPWLYYDSVLLVLIPPPALFVVSAELVNFPPDTARQTRKHKKLS